MHAISSRGAKCVKTISNETKTDNLFKLQEYKLIIEVVFFLDVFFKQLFFDI